MKITVYYKLGADMIEMEVEFEHQPEERQTREYPGCPASVEIQSVTINESENLVELLADNVITKIEEIILFE